MSVSHKRKAAQEPFVKAVRSALRRIPGERREKVLNTLRNATSNPEFCFHVALTPAMIEAVC